MQEISGEYKARLDNARKYIVLSGKKEMLSIKK
jgi:hypothetical protein